MQKNSSTRRHFLKAASMAAGATALAGCSGILPGRGPLPSLYRLSPKSTFREDLPRVDWQLVLEATSANASLNTTKIALQRDPIKLEYYANAGWIDKAPSMVQTLLVESFENTDKIISVGREAIGLRSDFILKTELREFQTVYPDGKPEALVTITAKIVQMPRRVIIGSRSFEQRVPAEADNLDAIVRAMDDALGKTMRQLVEWTLTTANSKYRG
ncbi:ABC-type transport auxiliary lipoprotein family protein [Kiloniella sp. b19]|uniref:ABC-type transport auxiliary lipoprotein family protein n=1 Tax=Kiloniella sp. GXU_MW_B19 TaxID=3141326 RepID=UPI0031D1C904